MADRKQGAGLSSESSAAVHKAHLHPEYGLELLILNSQSAPDC